MSPEAALELLRQVPPFDHLSAAALQRLADALVETSMLPGQAIVREGERGDRMYFLAEGAVQVLGRAFDGSDVVLARQDAGSHFGAQALLPGGSQRRSATVRALTHGRLLVLSREALLAEAQPGSAFAAQLQAEAGAHDALRAARLREGVLRRLGGAERYRLDSVDDGQHVFRQGDPPDRLYLVLQGRARVSSTQPDGSERDLTELLPGQMFGERAVLHAQPRSASVRAVGTLQLASLDAGWFRSHVAEHPQLQSILQSLDGMYLLPRRGLLTLQTGQLAAQPTLTAIHDLPDGRRVISTRLVGRPSFTARVVGAPEPDCSVRFEDPDSQAVREVHLVDGVPVEIECNGDWPGLGEAFEGLLDAQGLHEAQLARFEASGSFDDEGQAGAARAHGVVCACAGASAADLQRAIDGGCHSVDQVAQATRATLVCGGCLPTVREMLGMADWTPARCTAVTVLGERVRAFRLQPLDRPALPFLPGQHLVVQGRIGTHWVQRPYTISSASGAPDEGYEITVQHEPEGVFSRWLFERVPGDTLLRLSPPGGHFHLPQLPPGEAVDAVCLVGGIGVTPALAMARSLAHTPGRGRLHIDYSVSEAAQAVAWDELQALAAQHPGLSCQLRTTRTAGRLGEAEVLALALARPAATFYLCGSTGHMAAMRAHLAAAGVPAQRVQHEEFHVAGASAKAVVPA